MQKTTNREINIWGSCVSRDAVEFVDGAKMGTYCARQSIISSVAPPVAPETFRALEFKDGTHPFHKRIVEEDFLKTSIEQLQEKHPDTTLILDLIEERTPIGVTKCGTHVTFSQAASGFSNARSLITRLIQPYSEEYVDLFTEAARKFSEKFDHRTIVIHKALYAEGNWEFENANRILSNFYDAIISNLNSTIIIEIAKELRSSNPNHKWGAAPYHYIDGYYQDFVSQLSMKTCLPISPKPYFTLQKAIHAPPAI